MGETNESSNYIDLQIEGMGIKIENSVHFEKSYYSYEYERAFHVLRSILKADKSSLNKEIIKKDESYNIIAFIGTRGSGKSSAMESFACSLKNIHKKENSNNRIKDGFSHIFNELQNYSFYVLPSIDGSLLESQEDIFKITLGQMYGELVRLNEEGTTNHSAQRMLDYQKRDVQKLFLELYRSTCKKDREDGNIEEATITSLKDLSNSLKQRRDFTYLVKQYLDLVYRMESNILTDQGIIHRYLVISIDDLDMNILNGYEMLEVIHRYLMVPGVIVLMSMDLIQLKMLCEGSFYEMVPKVNKILKQRQGHISKLATEYTDKVLPIGSRIYMPDFKHRTNLRISYSENAKGNGENIEKAEQIVNARLLKDYFFIALYKKSGMRFDNKGKKWHFYIPETMRGTVNFYLMLNQINDLNKLDDKISGWDTNDLTAFKTNYTYLIADIQNRMAAEKLGIEQYLQFQRWTDNQLERTCMTVASHVSKLAERGDDEEKERLREFRRDYADFEYSYGELLRSLYLWGRTHNSNKKIVHCILADLTAKMTRCYYDMLQIDCQNKQLPNEKKKKNPYRETLSYILNGSMLGSWSNRMLPAFEEAESTSFSGIVGALSRINASAIRFRFSIPGDSRKSPKMILKNNNNDEIEEYRKIFRTMEFFALFFTEKKYKNMPTMSWKLTKRKANKDLSEEVESSKNLPFVEETISNSGDRIVYFESGTPDFNMYGFMANMFDWGCKVEDDKKENSKNKDNRSKLERLEDSLYDCLFAIEKKKNGEESIASKRTREEFLERIGIQKEMLDWYEISAGFVLPFYSVDITYNILKRMRQDRYAQLTTPKKPKDIFECYQDTLIKTGERLEESDKYYNINTNSEQVPQDRKDVSSSFYKRFIECPFVKWAMNPKKYLVNSFEGMFEDMLSALVSNNDSGKQPHTIEDEGYD